MKLLTESKRMKIILMGLFAIVLLLLGISYAFFSYVQTGSANTVSVGRISFVSTQTTMNLQNVYPVSSDNLNNNANVGTISITITGDTDYSQGVEYLVSIVNSSITTTGGTTIPIGMNMTISNIGTESSAYFAARENTNAPIYKKLMTNEITGDENVLVGFIPQNTTIGTAGGINGSITIKAYIDADRIAISDTYDGTETGSHATTTEWVNGRTVITTSEWNYIQQHGVSFQIRIVAQEGIWVKDRIKFDANGGTVSPTYKEIENNATTYGTLPTPTASEGYAFDGWYTQKVGGTLVIASTSYTAGTSATTLYAHYSDVCPGPNCKYIYPISVYYYGGANNADATEVSTLTGVTTDYTTLNKNYFIGFTETADGKIDRAYACGIKGENPNQGTLFCIEGSTNDSTYAVNKTLLNGVYGPYNGIDYGCNDSGTDVNCYGDVEAWISNDGDVSVGYGNRYCGVSNIEDFWCD